MKEQSKPIESKVIREQVIKQGKWLGMKMVDFMIGDREVKNYETVYRTTTKDKGFKVDGAEVIPIIKYKQRESEIVLISNFRPPVNQFNLEFPSGLNEDENFEENAKRQLRQEAGLIAKQFIKIPTPITYSDPWKSNECSITYLAIIDGDDPSTRVKQQLDGEENIRIHYLPYNTDLIHTLSQLMKKNNYTIQSKVWTFALGLAMNKLI